MRLELARAAFPDDDVRLDPYPRTIDLLRAESFDDPLFVIGADQFCDFLSWKEPDAVLELRAARGRDAARLSRASGSTRCSSALDQPERVVFFDIEPNPAASRDIRALAAAGEPLAGLVPDGGRGADPERRALRRRIDRPQAVATLVATTKRTLIQP